MNTSFAVETNYCGLNPDSKSLRDRCHGSKIKHNLPKLTVLDDN